MSTPLKGGFTHRSLYGGCDLPCPPDCASPLYFMGSRVDPVRLKARQRDPVVEQWLCTSCDEVIELGQGSVLTFRYSTSFRPRPRGSNP